VLSSEKIPNLKKGDWNYPWIVRNANRIAKVTALADEGTHFKWLPRTSRACD
jgi:hypothetical protein